MRAKTDNFFFNEKAGCPVLLKVISKGSPVTCKGRRAAAALTPTTFQQARQLIVGLISSPSLLCIRRTRKRSATDCGLVDRRMPRESNPAYLIANSAS